MTWIDPEQVAKAKEMSAIAYLLNYEPNELVKLSPDSYCTRTHDSLKLSNGNWYWWSRGIGGRSAVDYLMAVKNMSFMEAVRHICECSKMPYRITVPIPKKETDKILVLPEKANNNEKAIRYLTGRGISKSVIDYCIANGLLYESKVASSVIFIGCDENGKPRYAGVRSTNGKRYIGDAAGSDKRYSFRLVNNYVSAVHFFEGAVDLLSYATLLELHGKDWKEYALVTLAGVYTPSQFSSIKSVPLTIDHYLSEHPAIKRIYLHFDNDRAGRNAAKAIANILKDKYTVITEFVPYGKDVNDYLCYRKGMNKRIAERRCER